MKITNIFKFSRITIPKNSAEVIKCYGVIVWNMAKNEKATQFISNRMETDLYELKDLTEQSIIVLS